MRNFLLAVTFMAVLSGILPCHASVNAEVTIAEVSAYKESKMQDKINDIGFKLLNANKIDKRIVFRYISDAKTVNAFASAYYGGKIVHIYKGITYFADSDDEFAAVLAHEIAHAVEFHKSRFQPITMALTPKKYELKADKLAVDYLVKAGYNPVAIIVIFNKFMGQSYTDWRSSHPLASKRIATLYEYIYMKYPEYLANNAYKNNIYYQNFLLTSVSNRKLLEEKITNPNPKSVSSKVKYK